jgi:hypothetical protein
MVSSPVRVETRGGEVLTVHFQREEDSFEQVWLEGSTTLVYKAKLGSEALQPSGSVESEY